MDYAIEVVDQGIFYGIGPEDDAFPSIPLLASFEDEGGNTLIAWWLPWNMQEYLPTLARIDIDLPGIHFKDPVLIDPLTGAVYDVDARTTNEGCSFSDIVLADYPMIVVERSTVELQ